MENNDDGTDKNVELRKRAWNNHALVRSFRQIAIIWIETAAIRSKSSLIALFVLAFASDLRGDAEATQHGFVRSHFDERCISPSIPPIAFQTGEVFPKVD